MGHAAARAPTGLTFEASQFRAVVPFRAGRIDVALRGELDIAGVPVLVAAMAPLLGLEGLSVELDARELSFLDASGIGCIARIRYMLRNRGGDLAMRSVSPLSRRVLAICGLSDLLAEDPPADTRQSERRQGDRRAGDTRTDGAQRKQRHPTKPHTW